MLNTIRLNLPNTEPMKQLLVFGLFFFLVANTWAQELNCQVSVNARQTGYINLPVFKTLEKSLSEFINQTNWTDQKFKEYEKIDCNIFITISEYKSGSFKATLQIQSSRPVFGSTLMTPVFNFKDEQFSFDYTEYQPLNYSQNTFESNLVSVISYYVYTVLGLDADTFSPLGGTPYFEKAAQIVRLAQQEGYAGWKAIDGDRSRFRFNKDILSPNFEIFRKSLYRYHRKGLDMMHENVAVGKKNIAKAIQEMAKIPSIRANSIVVRSFFDAKAAEIQKIFSGGPSVGITQVVEVLNELAPQHNDKWGEISF